MAVGSSFNGDYESYFDLGSMNDYFKDLLEIETENNFKLNKTMIFNKKDNLYRDAKNTFHICGKTYINEVGDHCHETGKNRSAACYICNLIYRQQKFIPVISHYGKGYEFNLLFDELFKQNSGKTGVNVFN